MSQKLPRHGLGGCADIEEHRRAIRDKRRTTPGHGPFCGVVQSAPFFLGGIGGPGRDERTAMHAFDFVRFARIGHIAPDGLRRDVKAHGKFAHRRLAFERKIFRIS